MPSAADFYIGCGEDMIWIGSLTHEGSPTSLPHRVRLARSLPKYLEEVSNLLGLISPKQGWPWKQETSLQTEYVYSFFDGSVKWACSHRLWVRCSEYKEMSQENKKKVMDLPLLTFPRIRKG